MLLAALKQQLGIDLSPRTLLARVPFVVLVIGALGLGLGVTLWLSTDAAERSYQLGRARVVNQALQQQKEALERQVLEAQAAPATGDKAAPPVAPPAAEPAVDSPPPAAVVLDALSPPSSPPHAARKRAPVIETASSRRVRCFTMLAPCSRFGGDRRAARGARRRGEL